MAKINSFIPMLAFMLVMSFLFFTAPAYAADIPDLDNLSVEAVWLEGDMLNISVTDNLTGIQQTLTLPLDEYAGNSEFVSVQATDRNGSRSNTIQFRNPFYVPESDGETPAQSESGIGANTQRPFTPDGTGTVVDNVTDGDGKEFFSIETEDGNVFYLIVDRQRSSENVYLLNAVTEDDLMSLAKPGGGTTTSGIPAQPNQPTTPSTPTEPQKPEPTPEPPSADNSGTIIFIVIAATAVGGAGYYFKILRPKKQAADDDGGIDDYEDDDSDYGELGEDGDDE